MVLGFSLQLTMLQYEFAVLNKKRLVILADLHNVIVVSRFVGDVLAVQHALIGGIGRASHVIATAGGYPGLIAPPSARPSGGGSAISVELICSARRDKMIRTIGRLLWRTDLSLCLSWFSDGFECKRALLRTRASLNGRVKLSTHLTHSL
jgi:hypothetical protein